MDRVRTIIDDADYRQYLNLIAEAEEERIYCRHDYHHALYVARLTYLLALDDRLETLSREKALLYAAGLLHDIGRWLEYSTGEDHCIASARLAEPILKRAGFRQNEIDVICNGVREHRSPSKSQLGGLLAKADDLSRDCYRCQSTDTCYKAEEMLQMQRFLDL